MTGFALTLWLYEKIGSALQTALLAICSYTPYVAMAMITLKKYYQKSSGVWSFYLFSVWTYVTEISIEREILINHEAGKR